MNSWKRLLQSMRLVTVTVLLTLLIVVSIATISKADVLYRDATGWEIVKAERAETKVYRYQEIKAGGNEAADLFNKVTKGCNEVLDYMYFNDPGRYVIFHLRVPEEIILEWGHRSTIIAVFVCTDGDTLELASEQFVFSNARKMLAPGKVVNIPGDKIWISRKLHDKDREEAKMPIYLSSTGNQYLASESGDVMVFVRYPFGKCSPRRVLNCHVDGVTPIIRRQR